MNGSDILAECIAEKREAYPLTPSQMGIYLSCLKNPQSTMYNIPCSYSFEKGRIDISRLISAIQKVVSNHTVFTAYIDNSKETPMMKLRNDFKVEVPVIKTNDLEQAEKDFVKPFDLEKDLLFRFAILESENECMFVMDIHHIIFDGTSIAVFCREIELAYDGKELPQEQLTQLDLAVYEERIENTKEYKEAKAYYDRIFAGVEAKSEIIEDFEEDKSVEDKPNKEFIISVNNDKLSYSKVKEFTNKIGVTPSTLFLGAYEYVISKFTNQSEVTACTVTHGRFDSRMQNTIGMMVRTLPLYANINEESKISDFLLNVRKNLKDTIKNDLYPFVNLASDYDISADIMLAYQSDIFNSFELDGVKLRLKLIPLESSIAKLNIMVFKENDGFEIKFGYRSDLYKEETIRSLADSYIKILEEFMIKDRLCEVEPADQKQLAILDEFNKTEKPYDISKTIVDLFEEQTKKFPENTAVVYKDKKFTYAQLDDITDRLAGYIHEKGIGTEDVVSVLIPRCEYMAIASLGVLKSGAAYQPLDPTYPTERLQFMIKDSDAKLLIADKSLLDRVPDYKGEVLLTEDIPNLPSCEKISVNIKPQDLFIMLYTSGSTGVPKGCMLEHRNIVSFCNWYRGYYKLTSESRVAAYASYGFDANMMDMYPALTTGASIYIIDEAIRLDLMAIERYFSENGITHSFMTTQVGRQFALEIDSNSISELSVGGEKLVPLNPPKNHKLFNLYGPTECTVCITAFEVDKMYIRVPVGKALDNTKLYVVDKYGKRVPPCVPGELWVAGYGVSRGYLNRPEQTEKVFVKNPFTDEKGYERIYKTGDIVRFLPDGNIDFVGRNDGQVKIRGFRIELSEVEKVIRDFDGIKDATVIARNLPSGGQCINAYIVSDKKIDINELNEFIGSQKPPYMIPAATMQIDEIPLNVNGKVNKRLLPEPEVQAEKGFLPPTNEIQQRIFDCISQVTGSNSFGINTDIFYAGVTSIGAIKLNVLLSKEFNTVIRTNDIKENNTVEKLEKFLLRADKSEQYDILPDYPITQTQNGIFIECSANPNTTIYNIPSLFKLGDKIDINKLKTAVENTINAHPYIKTKLFLDENGDIRAARNDSEKAKVEIVECDELPKTTELVQPYELLDSSLYKAKIYKTNGANYLFLELHHIICDGTSMAVIIEDINSFYSGKTVETESYTGFEIALDEEKVRKTEVYIKAKEYYDSIFSGCDTDFLPVKDKNESVPSVGNYEFECDLSIENIKKYCADNNITLNAFFNGVFGFVLSKYNYKDEALYTTVYNGRNDSRLSRAVTMLVKTFPVLCNTDGEKRITDLLTGIKKQLMDSMSNDIYSFAEISRAYDIKADIMFVYQGDSFEFDTIAGEKTEQKILNLDTAKAPLNINVFIKNNKIVFQCEYRADMYEQSTIMEMVQCLSEVSQEFLKKTYLKEVSLLSADTEILLNSFNETEKNYEKADIVTLFRKQAEQNPDNTAVVYLDKSYTYKEADEISERIATYISSLGIGREDIVSVLIPRNEYIVLASLGVLKSGAAYQPLDPTYPTERLQFMIKDSAAKLLIADKSLLGLVPDYKGKILLIEDIPNLPSCEKISENPKPQDLFIMLYTSGSTGVPKGCMLEHRNIVSFCNWYRDYYKLTSESRVAAYASYGFDANMMDMYPALTTGASVYIIDEAIRLDLMAIERYFSENGITHSFMTTQVGRQFALEIDSNSISELSVGGEKLVPLNPPKNHKLFNLYGPTECTICITAFEVDKMYIRVPVGKALDNTKLYVVDKYGKRVPPCVPGELWVAGHGVSRGYLNRPEQTEKVFVKNPFTDEKGYERIYKTGDIVRFLPDGNIDFVGRNDGQVKIRGFRIELSEVEKVIRDFDGIKDATVIARNLPSGGQCINAYIVSDKKIDINELNEFIGSQKPPYMIPAATMQIDKIPLNVNGKVDKRKLLELKPTQKEEKQDNTQSKPLTLLEKKIFGIIEKIIGHNEFSISENLMYAGMTSLSLIKLAVELNKEFGFEAKVKQMMKGCSVISIEDELQEYLMSGAMAKNFNQSKQKQKVYKPVYPLSKTQLGVYLDCMKNPYSTLYNIPSVLIFPKSVNANKLADSVKQVILAHPYILTHLTIQSDDIEQTYVENPSIEIPVERLSESEFEVLKKDFVKPHNLMKAPLFRIRVAETEKNVYLVMDFHHIIFDGGSLNIFMNQLKSVYEGKEIEAEEYTYFDYIEDEIKAENGEEYNNAEKLFEDMLKNFESASEITPDLNGHMEDGKLAEVSIPFEMSEFESFCSENGVTPAQLFLAGSFYTVSRFVNSRNVYLSTISNGRSDMRLTNCFGMFVKTLPLGIEIEDISALEFVEKSKAVFTGSIENEIYPYAKICSKFGFAPNIVYEYQLGVTDDLVIDGSVVGRDYLEMNTAKFKTAIYIENYNNKPCVVVRYNDALYSKELMQTLVKSILNTTKHIIENPQGKIRKISMLDSEQLKTLEDFSSTLIAPVETKLLHKMFEKQAEKTPDRNALVACDRTLTYSELNRLANITANELIARGLKKGGKVVVLLERTSKIFTTIFGILKAGGAFIPTCPDYPKDRIDSIIKDSEADFVVTEGELLDVYNKTIDVNVLLGGENSETPNVDVQPEDLAYLIYTSGSTGKPKGVMLRHIGIANYVTYSDANIQVKYVVDNCKAYGSVTTVSFDMSLKETVLSLCNGLTLVFANDEQTLNPISLAKFLKENNVDVFNSTPSRLLQYMELDEFAEVMASCKVILSGGEKYPNKLLKLLREKTNAKIINTYGPTEITVSSNAKDLTNADSISVGRPLMNYIEHIVDVDGNRVPIGVVGELLISGCGVALGYNKLPEQTEKSFVEFEGKRTYRSGDYAKWTQNGDVVILGRTDNQVKLRGLRIELSEIEKCLSNIDGIKSSIALIRKVNKADAICAYYIADKQLDVDYIRNELKKSLTDYMVPTVYVQLSEMPLTPNGKINTKLLPEPQGLEKNSGVSPSTKLEKNLCDIFAKVLELDTVYADDNFFDIGGSSLTVTRVIILANKSGIEISYGDVFANPTSMALAKLFGDGTDKNDFVDLSNFDYSNIDKLLMNNNLESFKNGDMQEIGNVLLTGAAGFLGIHILYELLHRYSGKVYCLLRDKNNNPAENRLNAIFYYYFEESLKEKYSDRIIILNGDVTSRESFDKFLEFNIDTVINCAANVKHFSKGTDIEDVNLYGTLNVIDFCKQADARLIHVSTMSVGGMFIGEKGNVTELKETQLYYGQHEGSKYTLSKFLAERAILDEVSKGFNAKIMRVGTLSARNSDGEYQINFTTNTFMGRLKANLIIGKYPYDMIEMPFELSPIDFVAKAILLLAQTPKECTVFHPFNNHMLMMGDLYMEMDKVGLHSTAAETEEYEQALEEAKQNPEKAKILSSMLAYQNVAHGQKVFVVGKSNKYTMQVLYRMGFRWPVTSLDYMKRFINALRGLGFFDFTD